MTMGDQDFPKVTTPAVPSFWGYSSWQQGDMHHWVRKIRPIFLLTLNDISKQTDDALGTPLLLCTALPDLYHSLPTCSS